MRLSASGSVCNRRRSNRPFREAVMQVTLIISFVLIGLMLLSGIADVVEGIAIKRARRARGG
jgi:hypothetical protein